MRQHLVSGENILRSEGAPRSFGPRLPTRENPCSPLFQTLAHLATFSLPLARQSRKFQTGSDNGGTVAMLSGETKKAQGQCDRPCAALDFAFALSLEPAEQAVNDGLAVLFVDGFG